MLVINLTSFRPVRSRALSVGHRLGLAAHCLSPVWISKLTELLARCSRPVGVPGEGRYRNPAIRLLEIKERPVISKLNRLAVPDRAQRELAARGIKWSRGRILTD